MPSIARWSRTGRLGRIIAGGALLAWGSAWSQAQSDQMGPTLDSFAISPTSVDLTDGAGSVNFVVEATDPSGVDSVTVGLTRPNAETGSDSVVLSLRQNGRWEGTLDLEDNAPEGIWSVTLIIMRDASSRNNLTAVFGENLDPNSFSVVNPNGDSSPPQLTSFTISPQVVDLKDGAGRVTFRVTATDDLSGVDAVDLRISPESGQERIVAMNRLGDEYVGVFAVSVNTREFDWSVDRVTLKDGAKNSVTFGAADLADAGYANSFSVVQGVVITTQPAAVTAVVGASASFSVVAEGTVPLTYQWRKDGQEIAGATAATYLIASVTAADAGAYAVVVTNEIDSVTSRAATLTISAIPVDAPAITTQPAAVTAEVGASASFSVVATGTAPFSYQWTKDGQDIPGATMATYRIAGVEPSDAGAYAVVVSNSAGSVTSMAATLAAPYAVLANLSVRTTLDPGQVLVVGAVVAGGTRDLLLRAAGPALTALDPMLMGLPDPQITLFGPLPAAEMIGENDDWDVALADTFASVGAFGFMEGSTDSAHRLATDGPFTVHASGKDGQGIVLVEAYDLSVPSGSRLSNFSARSFAGMGDDTLIAGFVIAGTKPLWVLIRAVGPALAERGVRDSLADPVLTIFDRDGEENMSNDDWNPSLADMFASLGAFPLPEASKDAALLVELMPGIYTAQVQGTDGGTGEALIEIYEAREP